MFGYMYKVLFPLYELSIFKKLLIDGFCFGLGIIILTELTSIVLNLAIAYFSSPKKIISFNKSITYVFYFLLYI